MTSGCAEREGKRACELECVGGRGLAVHVPRRATQHASRWPGPGPTKRPRFVAWHRFARGRLASQNSIRAECGPAYGGVPCTDGSGVVVVFGGEKGHAEVRRTPPHAPRGAESELRCTLGRLCRADLRGRDIRPGTAQTRSVRQGTCRVATRTVASAHRGPLSARYDRGAVLVRAARGR